MGRSEDLFARIATKGSACIDEFIADRQSEELFLDFKRSADDGMGERLHVNDRANLAKAISGFGNSEGGVILWGVDCRDLPDLGDVASAKYPLDNPSRFVSWLEGAVSGCTLPPHPSVSHLAFTLLGDGTKGFVATHIPRSYLAPHQTIKPPQFYVRAGSNFEPTPYGVLAGLFGRAPQTEIFHFWAVGPVRLARNESGRATLSFTVHFCLNSRGPGMARDAYANVRLFPPDGDTTMIVQVPDKHSWTVTQAFGLMFSFVAKDGTRIAPECPVGPFGINLIFAPPFNSEFRYQIFYGHANSRVHKIDASFGAEVIRAAFDACVAARAEGGSRAAFIKAVFGLPENDEDIFDADLASPAIGPPRVKIGYV